MGAGGDTGRMYIFSLIAFFLVIIASINFMNLTTAQSITRAREVGVRKVTLPSLVLLGLIVGLLSAAILPYTLHPTHR
jgi:hypothetical protein